MNEEPQDSVIGARDLRILIANERPERLAVITEILTKMGHVVVAAGVEIAAIGETTRREHPDVALVAVGESSEHALDMISKIVHEAACPVIALLHTKDPDFVDQAGTRGVFAHITDEDPEQLQSTVDIVFKRFAEYHNLEGAFARRATIERAKGILMATHSIDEHQASRCSESSPNNPASDSSTSPRPSPKATACSPSVTSTDPLTRHIPGATM